MNYAAKEMFYVRAKKQFIDYIKTKKGKITLSNIGINIFQFIYIIALFVVLKRINGAPLVKLLLDMFVGIGISFLSGYLLVNCDEKWYDVVAVINAMAVYLTFGNVITLMACKCIGTGVCALLWMLAQIGFLTVMYLYHYSEIISAENEEKSQDAQEQMPKIVTPTIDSIPEADLE